MPRRCSRLLRPLDLLLAGWFVLLAGSAQAARPLTVHFFDIGQGDAQLIISPTGKTVLIDGGPPAQGAKLAARIQELTHGPLDLVIMTHPHLDHLGGMVKVVQAVGAKRFLEPDFDHPSAAYRELLEVMGRTVEQKLHTADPSKPEELMAISLGEGVKLWLLWPRVGPRGQMVEPFLKGTRSDVNANSVVAKLVYGKTAFLLVGDAEPDTEDYLLQKNIDFASTVLKVGHHGGRHSSTAPFVARVRPKAAVISSGAGNDYGHPTAEAMSRLTGVGARIFRTDRDGEVIAVSDGETVRVTSENKAEGPRGIAFPGDIGPVVATGPILPGERRLSQSSLEDRARYGKRRGSGAEPEATAGPAPAGADPQAEVRAAGHFAASRRSKVFHQAECRAVSKIKPDNLLSFSSRAEAAKDRTPARDCNP